MFQMGSDGFPFIPVGGLHTRSGSETRRSELFQRTESFAVASCLSLPLSTQGVILLSSV